MTIAERITELRARQKKRNFTARVQMFLMAVLGASIIIHIVSTAFLPVTTLGLIQTVLGTGVLAMQWFHRATERHTDFQLARGIAGELLIGMGNAATMNPRFAPSSQESKTGKKGAVMRVTMELAIEQQAILSVSKRVAVHTLSPEYRRRITDGWMARISLVTDEYRFTAEDVEDIAVAMMHDPRNVAAYRTILDLIEFSEKA